MTQVNVAVLASHTGTNLMALHRDLRQAGSPATVRLVISNNADAGALRFAASEGISAVHLSSRTHPGPGEVDQAMRDLLLQCEIGLVVTAGYMRKVGPLTLSAFRKRILNVHPALLPRHGGQGMYGDRVHQAVLDSGDEVSGPTVHWVTAEYDAGAVIACSTVPVFPDDTVGALKARVLAEEHVLLPRVVRSLAQMQLESGR